MKYTIIADSSCDLKSADISSENISFITVPLTITLGDTDYVDEENLDINKLVLDMKKNKGSLKTACPSVDAFANAMKQGDNIICVTISSKLSGTYNSARLAAEMVLAENPNKNIFILDSLLASGGMTLIITKLKEIINKNKNTFNETVNQILKVQQETNVSFLLQDYGNLIKTGRMSKISGIVAGILTIKLICGNRNGEIKVLSKVMGLKKAITVLGSTIEQKVKNYGKGTPIIINHCQNEADAFLLKQFVENKYKLTNVKVYPMRGLASFYANNKGLLIAY